MRSDRGPRPVGTDISPPIAEALERAEQGGFDSATEFVDAIASAIGQPLDTTAPRTPAHNPYKGLRAFDEADARGLRRARGAGRRLVDAVCRHRLVAVVGPSGSGKSSVVRAGLLPALREGAVDGSDSWFLAIQLPGAQPFDELAAALTAVAIRHPAELLSTVLATEHGVARAVRQVLPPGGQLLLVVDQLEELYTHADPAEASRFLEELVEAVSDRDSQLRVVFTLRADFYDRPLSHEVLGRLVQRATIPVLPLSADELERAIVHPAVAHGAVFEPGLVAEMIADVVYQPGGLPLLQFTLTELWDRCGGGLLTLDAYRELGGTAGSLARRAESIHARATMSEREAIRRAIGRLVTLGEGNEDTRRRARRRELSDDDATQAVLGALGSARLLIFDRDPGYPRADRRGGTEALLRAWPRLRLWLEDDREGLRLLRHLGNQAGEWDDRGRPVSDLYRGGRLDLAEARFEDGSPELNDVERAFLNASLAERQRLADDEVRRTRRLRRLLAGTGALAMLALVAGTVAFQQARTADRNADRATAARAGAEAAQTEAELQQSEAESERDAAEQQAFDAETGRLVGASGTLADTNSRVALLLAVAAHQRDPSPATRGALQRALVGAGPLLGHLAWGTEYLDASWLADGRVVGVRRDGIDLFDPATGAMIDAVDLDILTDTSRLVRGEQLAASATGGRVAVGTQDGQVVVLTVDDGLAEVLRLRMNAPVQSLAFDAVDDVLVVADDDNVVTAWTRDGQERFAADVDDFDDWYDQMASVIDPQRTTDPERGRGTPITSTVRVVDGEILVLANSLLHRLGRDGTPLGPPILNAFLVGDEPIPTQMHEILATIDGRLLLGGNASFGLLDATAGLPNPLPMTPLPNVWSGSTQDSVAFALDPAGRLVTLLADGALVWVDPATGREAARLDRLGFGTGRDLATSPDGRTVAVAHRRGLSLVSLTEEGPLTRSVAREPGQNDLSLSADGTLAVLGPTRLTGAAALWRDSAQVFQELTSSPLASDTVYVLIDPDGHQLVRLRVDGGQLFGATFDVETLQPLVDEFADPLTGEVADTTEVGPEGFLRAIGRADPSDVVILRDPSRSTAAAVARTLPVPPGAHVPSGVAFDPSGERLLVAGDNGRAQMWDVTSWTTIDDARMADYDIAAGWWSTDGSLVATASSAGVVSVRDGRSFEVIRTMTGSAAPPNTFWQRRLAPVLPRRTAPADQHRRYRSPVGRRNRPTGRRRLPQPNAGLQRHQRRRRRAALDHRRRRSRSHL